MTQADNIYVSLGPSYVDVHLLFGVKGHDAVVGVAVVTFGAVEPPLMLPKQQTGQQ
jgi:hypothetical protein